MWQTILTHVLDIIFLCSIAVFSGVLLKCAVEEQKFVLVRKKEKGETLANENGVPLL